MMDTIHFGFRSNGPTVVAEDQNSRILKKVKRNDKFFLLNIFKNNK